MRIKFFGLFFALMSVVGCTPHSNDEVASTNKYKGQILVPLPPLIDYNDNQ